ncbi:DUF4845 domain-containing protein [Comamonas aquatica]|jgi:hypothetical protein|uniref:DUF4845 domain-containing protein n=1 Tax=Comamonas aquatica TaxID=225991 RepID=UPI0005A8578E|nr:DUF4845 domain-containing protein [Comamonas aquatica]MDH1902370.1 DUF4845 domain-containing protein [Comamonas aquatica]WBM42816.1 DUF4845 domain-containing protein [Comamonas aquatica]
MRSAPRHSQKGLSFIGFVLIAVLAVAVFAIGGQSLPMWLEYQAAKKASQKAAREGTTVPEVRNIFDRAAQIDDIKSLRGQDLDVSKVNERVVVGFEYERDIPLVGPAYLVYRFSYQTK